MFRPRTSLLAVTAALFLCSQPSDSRADVLGWLADVLVGADSAIEEQRVDPVAMTNMDLPEGAIVTGPQERRTITLGRDLLELYPGTAVTIESSPGSNTTIRVYVGTIRSKVAKRKGSQFFQVKTHYIVATVKGTDFEVSTTQGVSALSVYEGRVALKVNGGVGGIDVTPGKTGTVSAHDSEARLGPTPKGGAAAAAKAVASAGDDSSKAASSDAPGDDQDRRRGADRDVNTAGRAASGPAGNSGGSGGGTGGGSDDGGDGGESGDGGEGGDDD
jgi:ferric-dicitrate binding protein FerR (iron transport regulator)